MTVMTCGELPQDCIRDVLARFTLLPCHVCGDDAIPGSYWGAPEAGLVGQRIYYRDDTPVHSLLHEAAHFICMTPDRRRQLDTDAGGDDAEECAVCYLEVLLADRLAPFSGERCLADMDAWGYSFREGSGRAWLAGDGREARDWLLAHRLIGTGDEPTGRLRD